MPSFFSFLLVDKSSDLMSKAISLLLVTFLLLNLVDDVEGTTFTFGILSTYNNSEAGRGPLSAYIATQTYAGAYAAIREANLANKVGPGNSLSLVWEEIGDEDKLLVDMGRDAVRRMVETKNPNVVMSSFFATTQTKAYCEPRGIPVMGSTTVVDPELYSSNASTRGVLNWRTSFGNEVILQVNYGLQHMHCTSWGILHIAEQGGTNDFDSVDVFIGILRDLDIQNVKRVYASPNFALGLDFSPIFSLFSDREDPPQCILCLGGAETVIPTVLATGLVAHVNPLDTYYFSSSLADIPAYSYQGSSAAFDNVYLVNQFPHPRNRNSQFIRSYESAIDAAVAEGFPTPFNVPVERNRSIYQVEGDGLGKLFAEIASRTAHNLTSPAFLDTAYRTKMFTIDDVQLGPISDGCPGRSSEINQACYCNVLHKTLYLAKIDGRTGETVAVQDNETLGERGVATLSTPLSTCDIGDTGLRIERPLVFLIVDVSTRPSLASSAARFDTVVEEAFIRLKAIGDPTNGRAPASALVKTIRPTTTQPLDAQLIKLERRFRPIAFVGGEVVPADILGNPISNVTALSNARGSLRMEDDPSAQAAYMVQTKGRGITFDPTYADYIHTAVSLWPTQNVTRCRVYCAFTSAADERRARLFVDQSLYTFGASSTGGGSTVGSTSNAETALATSTSILVVTDVSSEIRFWLEASASHPAATIIIVASESLLADVLALLPLSVAVSQRVFFPSILRAWWYEGASSSTSTLLGYYRALFSTPPNFIPHPSELLAMRTVTLLEAIRAQTVGYTTQAFLAALYRQGSVSAFDTSIGPVSNDTCRTDYLARSVDRQCKCGKGARRFFVHKVSDWRLRNPNSPSYALSYTMATCGIDHVYATTADVNPVPIAVGVSVAALVVVMAGFAIFNATAKSRDNAAAPKDDSQSFTIVFTDIQSSTSLWARLPATMATAVDDHHDIIRLLIKRFNGYEVKTIGDSFMVAFKSPTSALEFALAIQDAFLKHDWRDGGDIQQTYTELMEATAPEKSVESVTSLWNGLRVRVGVHTGKGSIQQDPVTLGYDYYGTVVNTAARVESVGHGGQVLITDSTFFAVTEGKAVLPPLSLAATSQDLGHQPLRGLSEPVQLFQVIPNVLQQRRFPPLRLDAAGDEKAGDAAAMVNDDVQSRSSAGTHVDELTTEQLAEYHARQLAGEVPYGQIHTGLEIGRASCRERV